MEFVSILQVLGRHRLAIAIGCAVALLLALSTVYRISPGGLQSRSTTAGTANAELLMAATDEPASDLRKRSIAATLPSRASLAGDLVATDEARADVARRAGIKPSELAILGPAAGAPPYAVPISVESTAAAAAAREPYRVRVSAQDELPILSVDVTAPDAASATRLAEAVRSGIEDVVTQRAGEHPVVAIEPLGPVTAKIVVGGPRKSLAAGVFIVLIALWCGLIVISSGIMARLRFQRTQQPVAAVES
jgi:hypothetical protein